jgi:lipoprotein-anchoring transpeptidase ErfK/SrfK
LTDRVQLKSMRATRASLVVTILLLIVGGAVASRFPIGDGKPGALTSATRGIAREPLNAATLPVPLSWPHILVKKAERKLFLYSDDKVVRTYRVGLGLSPVGDKVRQGDRRTPEGDFYIFTKNDKSAFYLSLGISYPNAAHAQRGLQANLITQSQYETIIQALSLHRTPPQNTKLGGDIYIHGNGSRSDWTWGCVALEDGDIRELFGAVTVGTPVTIKP